MSEVMTAGELVALVRRVFRPRPEDRGLAVLVDLPDAVVADNPRWRARRQLAATWARQLAAAGDEFGLASRLVLYRNAHTNNGDLPPTCWLWDDRPLPDAAEALAASTATTFDAVFAEHRLLLAPTELSATAPLKLAAKRVPIRAATMPGFSPEMIPALRLDYGEVNRRVVILKELLDRAQGADLLFRSPAGEHRLHLDLRYRTAHASGGLLTEPGTAGNLPSGEAYIVPYEGERDGEPSGTNGMLPVQFGDEIVLYRVAANRAIEVTSVGVASERERALLAREPAYGNLAELGLGVLADFGVKPSGEILLDEKLGLHLAFGRSDHFGGQVGARQFSRPEAVVHIDRVYVPEMQAQVSVAVAELVLDRDERLTLMRDGRFVVAFA